MSRIVRFLSALVLSLAFASGASAQSAADQVALKRAAARGEQIYAYDQAAWVTTDVMLKKLPDPGKAGIRGWVILPKGEGLTAIYYGEEDGKPFAVFSGDVRGRKVVASKAFGPDDDRALSPEAIALVTAPRAIALTDQRACTRGPFNRVTLPPERPGGPTLVYLLSPQVEANIYPFGGHFLFEIGPDGKSSSVRGFTRSCLNMSAVDQGSRSVAGLFITHLLDQTPTEIHVWLSLWTGKTVYVGTTAPQRVWSVNGAKITLIKTGP
ncbi:MAG: hypothetical protein K9G59_00085 [Caulobacter sp.]|nr:hypothetical protein [Caulobacter sp.]